MPRPPSNTKKTPRHAALETTLDEKQDGAFRSKPHQKLKRKKDDEEQQSGETYISGNLSRKLMKAVEEQQKELELADVDLHKSVLDQTVRTSTLSNRSVLTGTYDDEDDEGEEIGENDIEVSDNDDDELRDYTASIDLQEGDLAALEMFLPSQQQQRVNVNEMILRKIQERETASSLGLGVQTDESDLVVKPTVDPKIISVYQRVGHFLRKYRSGKLPKHFKIIASLKNWEEILYYTNPSEWSPAAVNAAVRLFSANFNPRMAQRFYSMVLLPRVEAMIEKDGKLNYHLYDAVKRAIYKPTAFFKGIILPIAFRGCSTKQAICIASILTNISIPTMHASVTLLQLAKMQFNPVQCLFLRVLLNKKYALPLPVVAAITEHFYGTITEDRDYPVLWFRTLLTFVQRYKFAFSLDQSSMLRALVKKRHHHILSDEIRRELNAGIQENERKGTSTQVNDDDDDDDMLE